MIDINGVKHGRAPEVAAELSAPGSKVTPQMVRTWSRRGLLPAKRFEHDRRTVLYPLILAGLVNAEKERSAYGRKRAA